MLLLTFNYHYHVCSKKHLFLISLLRYAMYLFLAELISFIPLLVISLLSLFDSCESDIQIYRSNESKDDRSRNCRLKGVFKQSNLQLAAPFMLLFTSLKQLKLLLGPQSILLTGYSNRKSLHVNTPRYAVRQS